MATDLAESLGAAIGLRLLFGLPLLAGLLITFAATYILLLLQGRGFRPIEMVIAAFIGVIAVCYLIELFVAPPNWSAFAYHAVVPQTRRTRQRHAGGWHHRRHRDAACDLPALQPDAEPHACEQRRRPPQDHRLLQSRGADRTRHRRPGQHGDAGNGRLGVPRGPRRSRGDRDRLSHPGAAARHRRGGGVHDLAAGIGPVEFGGRHDGRPDHHAGLRAVSAFRFGCAASPTMVPAIVVVGHRRRFHPCAGAQPGRAEPGAAGADDRPAGTVRPARRHGSVRLPAFRPRCCAIVAATVVLALNLVLLLQTAGMPVSFLGTN